MGQTGKAGPKDYRTTSLAVSLMQSERERIATAADELNETVSCFLRTAALDRAAKVEKRLARAA